MFSDYDAIELAYDSLHMKYQMVNTFLLAPRDFGNEDAVAAVGSKHWIVYGDVRDW